MLLDPDSRQPKKWGSRWIRIRIHPLDKRRILTIWKAWCFLWRAEGLSMSLEILHVGQSGTLVFIIQTNNVRIPKCWKRADQENVMYYLRKRHVFDFLYTFWWARVCLPLLCLCRPFCIFERCLDSSCRSKQARYQLSHPSPIFFYLSINQHVILGRR